MAKLEERLRYIIEAIWKGDGATAAASKDIEKVGTASKKTKGDLDFLKAGMVGLGAAAGLLAAGALAKVGQAMVGLASDSIDLASDLAETASLVNNSLGPAAESYRQELELISDATGRSSAALEMGAQTIVAMSRSMGMAQDEAAAFSATMSGVALDLSSFFNKDTSLVFEDLQSALAGSMETMQKYGIDIRQSRLEQIALENGLIETGEAMDQAARAQAVLISITEQASDAMGDAARTSEGYANQQRALADTVMDAQLAIGQSLLPAATSLTDTLSELADDVLPKLMQGITPGLTEATGILADEFERIADSLSTDDIADVAGTFSDMAVSAAEATVEFSKFVEWLDKYGGLIRTFREITTSPVLGITNMIKRGFEDIDWGQVERAAIEARARILGLDSLNLGRGTRSTVSTKAQLDIEWDIPDTAAQIEQAIADALAESGVRGQRRIQRLSASSGWSLAPFLNWQEEVAAAAQAAAAAYASTFQQSLQTEGGIDFGALWLNMGVEAGMGQEQLVQLGLAAGFTGEQLKQAAIDAALFPEAIRLFGQVQEGTRSVESMQWALEKLRGELENWKLEVPAREVSTAGEDIKRATLGMEGISTTGWTNKVIGPMDETSTAAGTLTTALGTLETAMSELDGVTAETIIKDNAGEATESVDKFRRYWDENMAAGFHTTATVTWVTEGMPPPGAPPPPGRASGGPVSHGMAYVVGEKGPEVFVPHSSGWVVPNGDGGRPTSMWAGGGGGPVTVNQNFNGLGLGASVAVARRVMANYTRGTR